MSQKNTVEELPVQQSTNLYLADSMFDNEEIEQAPPFR